MKKNNEVNFLEELGKVMSHNTTYYRGVAIDKIGKEFKVIQKTVSSEKEARDIIDQSFDTIANSIKK